MYFKAKQGDIIDFRGPDFLVSHNYVEMIYHFLDGQILHFVGLFLEIKAGQLIVTANKRYERLRTIRINQQAVTLLKLDRLLLIFRKFEDSEQ